jgi:putative membrane protein
VTANPVPPSIAAIDRPAPVLLKYYALKALASTVAFPVTMLLLYFPFHTLRFRFDAEGIHMGYGILLRREIMLNYSRIQDIQLRSNVVERWLGLTRIEIQTASGSADSEMTLEGLLNFVEVRDFLYSRMRGARQGSAAANSDAPESLSGILEEVAIELRAIREAVERQGGHGSLRG